MYIQSLGTAVPDARYSQADCWNALQASRKFGSLGAPARALLQRVLCGDSKHLLGDAGTLHRLLVGDPRADPGSGGAPPGPPP